MFAWHLKRMASSKRAPKVSKISRAPTVAFARKQRPTGEAGAVDDESDDESAPEPAVKDAAKASSPATDDLGSISTRREAGGEITSGGGNPVGAIARPAAAEPASKPAASASAPASPAEPSAAEAAPEIARARVETVSMPSHATLGAPPAMPPNAAVPAPPVDVSVSEAPTQMPGPREIPPGNPDDPAQPPGTVPAGDSRSLRRRADRYEFALIYRRQTYVISRFGVVGTRGQWRVVEYPTSGAASHAYAKECSRFAADGFSDYRE
jgi:hypothetical protein